MLVIGDRVFRKGHRLSQRRREEVSKTGSRIEGRELSLEKREDFTCFEKKWEGPKEKTTTGASPRGWNGNERGKITRVLNCDILRGPTQARKRQLHG